MRKHLPLPLLVGLPIFGQRKVHTQVHLFAASLRRCAPFAIQAAVVVAVADCCPREEQNLSVTKMTSGSVSGWGFAAGPTVPLRLWGPQGCHCFGWLCFTAPLEAACKAELSTTGFAAG